MPQDNPHAKCATTWAMVASGVIALNLLSLIMNPVTADTPFWFIALLIINALSFIGCSAFLVRNTIEAIKPIQL